MNIKKFTFLLFVFITFQSISQNSISFGVKGGLNFTGFHSEKKAFTSNVLFNFGGVALLNLTDSFSLQAELVYNKKGGQIDIYDQNTLLYITEAKLDYIDIPVLAKFEFLKNLSFDIGPQIGFLLNSKGKITGSQNEEDIEFTNTNTIDFAVNGGFSFKFNNSLFLQTRYSYGLSKIFENSNHKNSVISLSLGYLFNK